MLGGTGPPGFTLASYLSCPMPPRKYGKMGAPLGSNRPKAALTKNGGTLIAVQGNGIGDDNVFPYNLDKDSIKLDTKLNTAVYFAATETWADMNNAVGAIPQKVNLMQKDALREYPATMFVLIK